MGAQLAAAVDAKPLVFARRLGPFRVATAGTEWEEQWSFAAFPDRWLPALTLALPRVETIAASAACNRFFSRIGNGQTLQALLARGIQITWSDRLDIDGVASSRAPRLALSERAVQFDQAKLVATLIHEIAHLGGVRGRYLPNDATSHFRAYQAEVACMGRRPRLLDEETMRAVLSFRSSCGTCGPR